jgi:glucosyl-dolichyl phosphate glucuronosyltransferase
MRITAVICTYDRYDILPEAIRALAKQSMPASDYEILVIDNSPSAKRSAAEAKKIGKIRNLTWVHETKAGLSNARNVALARAQGEVIGFLDDDALAAPSWCEDICAAFDDLGEDTAVIGGRVTPLFRSERPAWLSDKLLAHLSMVDLGEDRRLLKPGEWVVGANIAYRTDLLRAVGGFSTNLGRIGNAGLLSAEETEVAAKLKAQGYAIGYDPGARAEHLVDASRTSQAWFARRLAWQAVSAVLAGDAGSAQDMDEASDQIRKYFAALHPADRHAGTLLVDQAEAGDLDWQLGTIYNLVVLLLSGGRVTPPADR